jgi:4-diphosphocytidyl-2-C-methyl-D-erythritol kinase
LSRALAAVWTTSGAELGNQISGPTGIARASWEASLVSRQGDLAENPLLALVRTGIENDFEEVAFSQHPSLRSTKRDLTGSDSGVSGGAVYAALSGSGSALFGLYATQADARAAQQRVQTAGTRAILTETLPRAAYWRTMME